MSKESQLEFAYRSFDDGVTAVHSIDSKVRVFLTILFVGATISGTLLRAVYDFEPLIGPILCGAKRSNN